MINAKKLNTSAPNVSKENADESASTNGLHRCRCVQQRMKTKKHNHGEEQINDAANPMLVITTGNLWKMLMTQMPRAPSQKTDV